MRKEFGQAAHSTGDMANLPFSMTGGLTPQPLTEAELERVAGGTFTGTLPIEVKCDEKGQCTSSGDCD